MLDALASAGLKLVPDPGGECSGEYYGVLKKAIRADKAADGWGQLTMC